MCDHLQPLESYLKDKGIPETFRGQAWSNNCREWVYFDCVLKTEVLKAKFNLSSFVETHENIDMKSGTELGLVCNKCKDGIMGVHPNSTLARQKVLVD
jgi:hypothetical protein